MGLGRLLGADVEVAQEQYEALDLDGSGALEWTDLLAGAILCQPGSLDAAGLGVPALVGSVCSV